MIKFFRQIRQNLIMENKSSKYFKYAIGEIILVVIGILIALQINNLNEVKKNQAFEKEILEQIRANLIKDKLSLEDVKINFEKAVSSSNRILSEDWSSLEQDSLKFWLGNIVQFERFYPLTNAYEVLKSKGLDQVSNKQLRFLLGSYYDDTASHAIKSIGDVEVSFNNDWMPIMKSEVRAFKFQEYVVVKDFNIFRDEHPARNIVRMNRDNFGGGIGRITAAINSITKIQELINQELN